MKLTNYNRGFNDFFDCSIHGVIKMTQLEFTSVRTWLLRSKALFIKRDLDRILQTKHRYFLNIRISATEKLVKKYNLTNYKRGNYIIEVIK